MNNFELKEWENLTEIFQSALNFAQFKQNGWKQVCEISADEFKLALINVAINNFNDELRDTFNMLCDLSNFMEEGVYG